MKKKIILIPLIIVGSILILIAVFGVIDFNRVMKGKNIIFPIHAYAYVADEEESSFNFSGIGYSISVCDKDNYSFHLGHKTDLSCFNVDVENKCNNIGCDIFNNSDENKIIAVDSCSATYSTDPYDPDKCIMAILEITFKDGKADYIKSISAYSNNEDAKAEYEYEIRYWSDEYTDPKPKLDKNKMIREGHISEFLGFQSSFEGLTKAQIEEQLRAVEFDTY